MQYGDCLHTVLFRLIKALFYVNFSCILNYIQSSKPSTVQDVLVYDWLIIKVTDYICPIGVLLVRVFLPLTNDGII